VTEQSATSVVIKTEDNSPNQPMENSTNHSQWKTAQIIANALLLY